MIRISVKPKSQEKSAIEILGSAIITLDVHSVDGHGLPLIESTDAALKGAISFKVLTIPHDKYGHIVDPDRHRGSTLLHCIQDWNEFGAYVVIVETGQEFILTKEDDLPAGAIP